MGQKSVAVERSKKRPAFLKRAKTVQTNGIEPFEDVAIFAMLRGMTVFFDEALDFFESGDDALLARGAPALFLSFLNLTARTASSLASSGVRLVLLAAMAAATCFRLSSLMVLARIA